MTGLQHLHTKRPSPQELPSELVQSQAQLKRKHLIHYVDLYFTVNTVVPATQSGHQLWPEESMEPEKRTKIVLGSFPISVIVFSNSAKPSTFIFTTILFRRLTTTGQENWIEFTFLKGRNQTDNRPRNPSSACATYWSGFTRTISVHLRPPHLYLFNFYLNKFHGGNIKWETVFRNRKFQRAERFFPEVTVYLWFLLWVNCR